MNENRMVKTWSLAALGAVAVVPMAGLVGLGAACGGGNSTPPNTAGANGSVAMTQPPPGYQPGAAPPGYPGAQPPPPGYPQGGQAGYPPPGQQQGYPPPQQGYPPPGQPQQAPPPSGAPSAAPGPLAATDPSSLQGILQGLGGALGGQMVMPGGIPGDPTEAGLKLLAAKDAPGMQPEGQELKQVLNEGQHAVIMVTLQAGKCYAIVGFSAPGAVKDLDLNLLAPPLYMTLAGQDLTRHNMPSIGAAPSPMCPVVMFPLQYKLDVFARSGSGQVAVQLFSKNK